MSNSYNCTKCRDRKHVYSEGRFSACDCVKTKKSNQNLEAAGALEAEHVKPLSSYNPVFGRFVRQTLSHPGPSWLCGQFPLIAEAARTALSCALAEDKKAKLIRLEELVNDAFAEKGRGKLMEVVASIEFLIVVCGDEPSHSWNGAKLALLMNRRRPARLGTLVIANGDLVSLYGERAEDCFRDVGRYPSLKIK